VAGDRGRGDRLAFVALVSSRRQSWCRRCWAFLGDRDHGGGLLCLAGLVPGAQPRRAAVVLGGLGQEPAGVLGAGLGDRALATGLPRALLRGDQADVADQLLGVFKPGEV
jgi:hypothetical protein